MQDHWYRSPDEFAARFEQAGCSVRRLSDATGIPQRTLRRYAAKYKRGSAVVSQSREPLGVPGVSVANDGTATITTLTRASGENVTPDDVLVEHGFDSTAWEVVGYTSNRWHAQTPNGRELFEQSKLVARKRFAAELRPAMPREPGWTSPKPQPCSTTRSRMTLVLGDPHEPLGERAFIEAQIELIREYQPYRIILLGDTADNSPWKRHKKNRRIDCSAQEAIDATYNYLASIRAAAPNAIIQMVYGNHDYWVIDRILETIPQLATLRQPGPGGKQIICLNDWLRLDELHIEAVETQGEYHDVMLQIMPDLVGMHGVKSGPYGGAVKEFDTWEGASVIQGHDHKTAIVAVAKRLADNTDVQRYAISVGTSARRDLGYDHRRNIGQSFVTLTEYDDGEWHPELGVFNPQTQTTTWRNWRYKPQEGLS